MITERRHAKSQTTIIVLVSFALVLIATLYFHHRIAGLAPYIDEGDMAINARIIHRGGLMYKDAFNEKGPGLYWIVAGLFQLFGDRLELLRYASAVGVSITLLILLAFGYRFGSPVAGLVAAALFAVSHFFFQGFIYQAEAPLTPLFMMAAYLLSAPGEERPKPMAVLFAGVALFCATTVKQTSWLIVFAAGLLLLADLRRDFRAGVKSLTAFSVGVVVPWCALFALVIYQGYFSEFLRGYLFPLREYAVDFYTYFPNRLQFFVELPLWWAIIVSLVFVLSSRLSFHNRLLCWLMVLATLATQFPAMFPYHFPPLLATTSLAFTVAVVCTKPGRRTLRIAGFAGLFVLTGIAATNIHLHELQGQFFMPVHPAEKEIVREIQERTKTDETIFVFPFNSLYYYWSDREHPGRHGFFLPWVIPKHVVPEVIDEFNKRPPKLIFFVYYAICTTNGALPKDYLAPLLDRIADDYVFEKMFDNKVAMLVPKETISDNIESRSCMAKKLLYTDLECGRVQEPPMGTWRRECGL